jgi:hypothetical protein
MTDPVDLDAKRKAKAPKCRFCGALAHEQPLLCPRVSGVAMREDDMQVIEIFFWDYWEPPVAGPDPV